MSVLHVNCKIQSLSNPKKGAAVLSLAVDDGKSFTWIPRKSVERIGIEPKKAVQIQLARGRIVQRDVGFAVLHVGRRQTVDEVVFAEKGDPIVLGSRALSGLNVRPDLRRKRLVERGPIPAAVSALSLTPNFSWVYGNRGAPLTASAVLLSRPSARPGRDCGRCGKPLKRLECSTIPLSTQLKLGVNGRASAAARFNVLTHLTF